MLRSGIIGLGFIGPAHIEALLRTGLSQVTAVADSNKALAHSCAGKFGIPGVYSDYRALVQASDVDVIHICAPNSLHYEIARAALVAGKHVVCEKPLATDAGQARELQRLAADGKRVGVTAFNLRYYPLVRQAKALAASGRLGRLYAYHGSYLQDWLLYETDYSWRLDSSLCGRSRAVADIGSHWIDMAEFVTGCRITALCADLATFLPVRKKPLEQTFTFQTAAQARYEEVSIDTEDFATILFRMDSGIRGSLTVSQVSAGRKNFLQFEADGSKGSLAWNSEQPNRLWLGHRDAYNEEIIKDPGLLDDEAKSFAAFPGGHAEGFPDTSKQLFRTIYEYILREGHLRGEPPPFPTFADGLREIAICDAILESSRKGAWIQV